MSCRYLHYPQKSGVCYTTAFFEATLSSASCRRAEGRPRKFQSKGRTKPARRFTLTRAAIGSDNSSIRPRRTGNDRVFIAPSKTSTDGAPVLGCVPLVFAINSLAQCRMPLSSTGAKNRSDIDRPDSRDANSRTRFQPGRAGWSVSFPRMPGKMDAAWSKFAEQRDCRGPAVTATKHRRLSTYRESYRHRSKSPSAVVGKSTGNGFVWRFPCEPFRLRFRWASVRQATAPTVLAKRGRLHTKRRRVSSRMQSCKPSVGALPEHQVVVARRQGSE